MRAGKRIPPPLNFSPDPPPRRDAARADAARARAAADAGARADLSGPDLSGPDLSGPPKPSKADGATRATPRPSPPPQGARLKPLSDSPPLPDPAARTFEPEAGPTSGFGLRRGPRIDDGEPDLGISRHAYAAAAIAAIAWAGILIAYTLGYVGGLKVLMRQPLEAALLLLMAVLPGLFMGVAAFAVRQGARLAAEARWARSLADDMLTPTALAAAATGDAVAAMREAIERAGAAAQFAHDRLGAMTAALSGEAERLTGAAAETQRTLRVMGDTFDHERTAMLGAAGELGARADQLSEGVHRQTRLVGEASDLVRSQLGEAEATLAAGAARLAAAGAEVGERARGAGDALGGHSERLDLTAAALLERLRFLDIRLSDQRGALAELSQGLQSDHDDLAARMETQRAHLAEAVEAARLGADELNTAAGRGVDALRGLSESAVEHAHELADTVHAERRALAADATAQRTLIEADLRRLGDDAAAQVRDMSDAVRAEREALAAEAAGHRQRAEADLRATLSALADAASEHGEHVRAASLAHVEAARSEIEQLNELAFATGQRADRTLEARLSDARRVIEQTAALVEDAGVSASGRIAAGLGAARSALGELTGALGEIDARMAALPAAAQRQSDSLRAALERNVEALTAATQRAAEHTQTLDAAFQERIRRNYETLSEAVKLMGQATGVMAARKGAEPPPASVPPRAAVAPVAAAAQVPASASALPAPAPAGSDFSLSPGRAASQANGQRPKGPDLNGAGSVHATPTPSRDHEAAEAAPPAAPEPALRPRLKLTPTASDDALRAVFDTARALPSRSEPSRPEPPPTGAGRPGLEPRPADDFTAEPFRAERGRAEPSRAEPGRASRPEPDAWTWKDLLTSMDDAPTDADSLAQRMVREIEAIGVDTAALLPPARVQEMAGAFAAGDGPTARDAVRRLAPAAVRRLSRRVLTDRDLREQTDRYVSRYESLLQDAADQGGGARAAAALLGSDAGRAYLLLDAAVGDL